MVLTIRWRTLVVALKDAWPTWLALGGIALPVTVGWVFSQDVSAAVRYAGTALQVLGLATVTIGLSETRRLFGRPSLPRKIWRWFRQLAAAFATPKPITLQVSDAVSVAMTGDARVVRGAGPGASLEDRVSVLEENLSRLRDELDVKKQEFRQEIQTVREHIERETQERRAENQQAARRIEEMAVGGLHLEIVGLSWLVLGVVGTSIPDEIAAVLRLAF